MMTTTKGAELRQRPYDKSLQLTRLLGIGQGEFTGWSDDDLQNFLHEQLALPLAQWLEMGGCRTRQSMDSSFWSEGWSAMTMGEFMSHLRPPVKILQLAKEVASLSCKRRMDPIPSQVASALYLTLIAVALIKWDQRISALSSEDLAKGLRALLSQYWIDASMVQFIRGALSALETPK